MSALIDPSWLSAHSGFLLSILLDASVKGFAVLLAAGFVCLLILRRGSASSRHLVWLMAMAALIALPVLSVLAPSWEIPILPRWDFAESRLETAPPPLPTVQPAPEVSEVPAPPAGDVPFPPLPAGAPSAPAPVGSTRAVTGEPPAPESAATPP